jgi:hypothetical protein
MAPGDQEVYSGVVLSILGGMFSTQTTEKKIRPSEIREVLSFPREESQSQSCRTSLLRRKSDQMVSSL